VAVASVTNINEVLDGHVALEVECVDRLYLNAYVPNLQVGGFCNQQLSQPIASPVVIQRIGTRFGRAVKAFAAANDIPILGLREPARSRWDDRRLDHVLADMLNGPPKSTARSTTGRRSASA
jgi:hypothetical protein